MMKRATSKRAQNQFPLVIQKGHAVVKIYRIKDRKSFNYTVAYNKPSGRVRKTFASPDLAKREANKVVHSLAVGDLEALKLTGAERQIYVEAERAIAPTGLPLHTVAHDYARAFDILGGAHIVEAARYYKQHVDVNMPHITAADAVEKFREAKEAEGLSKAYLHDIVVLLGDFARCFQCPLSNIQPDDLQQYLNAKRVGMVSKDNRRRLLVTLFNFAKAHGWLRKNEQTAADALGTYKIKQREVEIYTPAEMSRLLAAADKDFLPYIALIAFGGIRSAELHKGLNWESVNFNRNCIIVPAAIAKTGRKRKIELNETLQAWLAPYRTRAGPIFNIDPLKRIAKVVKTARVKWKRNGLRHSFGSYRMEQTKNEGLVALEMGSSPVIVKDHYFEIVDDKAAKAYWSIKPLPPSERKIVPIAS